jgi:predicted HicB family RNase H-like nuclease
MKRSRASYLLRLSISLKFAAEKAADREGVSLNQFIVLAVAEKVARIQQQGQINSRVS